MHSVSIAFADLRDLQESVLAQSLADTDKTLIQIFSAYADKQKIELLQDFFKKNFPHASLIGSTTDGIVDGTTLYNDTKSLAVFSYFENSEIEVGLSEFTQECDSFCCGKTLAYSLVKKDTKVIIAFGDGLHLNGEEFVNGVSHIAPDVVLSGGLAGDNGKMQNTYVFDKKRILDAGVVAVALHSTTLHVTTKYSFDWTALGKKLKVTKAIKNRVYEIDGMTTVDIYAKYFGHEVANQLPQVGIEFPLIFEQNGVEIGRAVLLKHNDGSLSFAGNIPEGTFVRFGVGNVERVLQSIHYNIDKLTQEMQYESESIFLYSCMARRRFLKEDASDELEVLKQLGPVFGFYTYGEFYHNQNSNQLLNETMTLLSLSESKNISKKQFQDLFTEKKHIIRAEHAVANLANTVSNELEELNANLEAKVEESAAFIYKQAYYDKLTKLPNRLSLIKNINHDIGKTILLINIDDFTTINDFYGYTTGDKLLQHLATLLQKKFKDKSAQIYKLPTDEFAITIDLFRNSDMIESSIKKVLELIENEKFSINGDIIDFTVTISAATANKEKVGLANADMTLKLAKKNKKEYMIFQEDLKLSEQYADNISMARMVKEAIYQDRIIPYFQPIYDMKTLQIAKYEALVRLQMTTGEIISPFKFLNISQKIKVYPKITEIMVSKTFKLMRAKGVDCTINLDFEDIYNPKTKKMLFDNIKSFNIANQLTIEILENQQMSDEEQFNNFIEEVRQLGVKIAIDDFGSGFANFEHIAKIHSDFIKIDGSLIKNIDKDDNARLIVETIVVFANKLKQKTVAEFVHSKEVYDIVKEIGVDYIQGYYFAEPQAEFIG